MVRTHHTGIFSRRVQCVLDILCETVCVNSIIKSGLPILSRMPFLNLQKTFALHPCLVQRSQYCRSMSSLKGILAEHTA